LHILIAIGVLRQKEAGAAGVVLHHAQELEKIGHEVECWFLDDICEQEARPGRFQALQFAMRIAKRILKDKRKFDVVNLHAPWGCVYGVWRKWLPVNGAPPFVMTMQGSEERYVQAMLEEERKGRAWNFRWKNRVWHRIYHQKMYDYSIKTADYGAVANEEARTWAKVKYKRDEGHISFVPNGTEERFFIQREYPEKESLALLYVGTWLDRKGVYYLADGLALLAKRVPGIRLTVAGTSAGEDEVRKFFAPEVRDRVKVIPFLTREEILGTYAAHDVFVFPSLVEGMPLTLLEAMATGMPVVTTNVCGMADVVDDGINGLLVPPADGENLAEAVKRLCGSAEMRKKLGQAAQQTMRSYTWERVTKKLEEILVRAAKASRN
jgi:glycosyltransferase involved in cell wall biosynthesis